MGEEREPIKWREGGGREGGEGARGGRQAVRQAETQRRRENNIFKKLKEIKKQEKQKQKDKTRKMKRKRKRKRKRRQQLQPAQVQNAGHGTSAQM